MIAMAAIVAQNGATGAELGGAVHHGQLETWRNIGRLFHYNNYSIGISLVGIQFTTGNLKLGEILVDYSIITIIPLVYH